jgi:putative hydrolase of the HAD superfamily
VTVDAVLFDLDDTLLDRYSSIQAVAGRVADYFKQPSLKDLEEEVFAAVHRCDGHGYVSRVEMARCVVESLWWERTPTEEEFRIFWDTVYPQCTKVFPDVYSVLDQLRSQSIHLGIITNGRDAIQRSKIKKVGLDAIMDVIVVSESVGYLKPHREIFRAALKQMGCSADRCAFVGDNPIADVKGAVEAGLAGIWKETQLPWPTEEAAPRYRISTLSELIPLVEGSRT